jgi:superfamily II DNA or RNA helicase
MNLRPYQKKAIDAIQKSRKGVCILPTGSGKTVIFMEDVKQKLLSSISPLTVVIVAPKILLCSQLKSQFSEYLKGIKTFDTAVHSGEDGITDEVIVRNINQIATRLNHHHLIFTTYRSLERVNNSVKINLAIFDEAHHCVQESNFVGIAQTSALADSCFFYTATPKHTEDKRSMCNSEIYGGTIVSLTPKELVDGGYILPPKVLAYKSTESQEIDILNFIDSQENENQKILVAAPSTQSIMDLFTETNLIEELKNRRYNILHITSKYGSVVNGEKVSREEFFRKLSELSLDDNERFILFHYSIISEGIDVPGFTSAILLRNLPIIEMIQTIGRILRLHPLDKQRLETGEILTGDYDCYYKPCGIVAVPNETQVGNRIEKKLQSLVNQLFVEGSCVSIEQ